MNDIAKKYAELKEELDNKDPLLRYAKLKEELEQNDPLVRYALIKEEIEVAIGIITKPSLPKNNTLIKTFKITDITDR